MDTGRRYSPARRIGGWTGRHKEVFDAELYAFYQATEIYGGKNGSDQEYTHHPNRSVKGVDPMVQGQASASHWPRMEVCAWLL